MKTDFLKYYTILWALLLLAPLALKAQTTIDGDSLQEVVVTGTGTQHLLKNAPVQTEVITSKMLRQYGGSSLQDILAGLTASLAFNEGDMGSQMQLNGLGNNYILVLVDGKRLHGDVGGENDPGLMCATSSWKKPCRLLTPTILSVLSTWKTTTRCRCTTAWLLPDSPTVRCSALRS